LFLKNVKVKPFCKKSCSKKTVIKRVGEEKFAEPSGD
jgi:hypothetical protein